MRLTLPKPLRLPSPFGCSRLGPVFVFGLILVSSAFLLWSLTPPPSASKAGTGSKGTDRQPLQTYADLAFLPLSFEENRGQTAVETKFLSRAQGYTLLLSPTEVVFQVSGAATEEDEKAPKQAAHARSMPGYAAKGSRVDVVRMQLAGANASPSVTGLDPLSGRSHYYLGNDPSGWITDVPTFGRVKYGGVYPGIDLVFYGTREQLEYDFVVAPGADPGAITLHFQGMDRIEPDSEGNLLVQTPGGELLQQAPVIYQEISGVKNRVEGRYLLEGDRVRFKIGAYDQTLPLYIDPLLSYSTFLGGTQSDSGAAVAVDAAGNTYVTGMTRSTDFPLLNPAQNTFRGGDPIFGGDAFVAKLAPGGKSLVYSTYLGGSYGEAGTGIVADSAGNAFVTGLTTVADSASPGNFPVTAGAHRRTARSYDSFVSKLSPSGTLVYSTYLGGNYVDFANAIAIDASGNAYVTGETSSDADFATPGSAQPTLADIGFDSDAFVAKLNSSGSALIYVTYLGGEREEIAEGIAVDGSGNAYVTGITASSRFPTVNPFQRAKGGIFRSSDAASSWRPGNSGLDLLSIERLVVDPVTPSTLYAITESNLYKSVDSGATWRASSNGIPGRGFYRSLAIDPSNPNTLYTSMLDGVFKSTNGAVSWSLAGSGVPSTPLPIAIRVDPADSSTVYTLLPSGIYKSTNGGGSWALSTSGIPAGTRLTAMAVDPRNSSNLYVSSVAVVFKSTNKGASWTAFREGLSMASAIYVIAVDPQNNSNLYAGTSAGMFKSTNGGSSWAKIGTGLPPSSIRLVDLAIDPQTPNTVYAATGSDGFTAFDDSVGVYKSTDGGASWGPANADLASFVVQSVAIDPKNPSNIYAGTYVSRDAFVTKLNASGSAFIYSTFLGGAARDAGAAIAVDGSGNAYVAGSATSSDFPTAGGFQSKWGGGTDAFVSKLSASGTALVYSSFLGGAGTEEAYTIALNGAGNAFVAGWTSSNDFPVSRDAFQRSIRGVRDAFVSKIHSGGSEIGYSTYLGGTGLEAAHGIAVDSSGAAYVTGLSSSADFPTLDAFQASNRGFSDLFVVRIVEGSPPSSDLAVTKTASPNPVSAGQSLTYTVAVRNAGPTDNTAVAITDVLPSGAAFDSAAATQGSCSQSGGTVTCSLGTLANGATATATIVVTPATAGSLSNTATAAGDVEDPDSSNNSATAEVTVGSAARADVSITKTASPEPVRTGSNLTYTLAVSNRGPSPASGVEVTDVLPSGAAFVSISASQGTCRTALGGARVCDLGALASGTGATVTLTVAPSAAGTISNTATVSAVEADPVPGNNSATATTTVTAQPAGADLAITKSAVPSPAAVGNNLVYSIGVSNRGPGSASAVRVIDALPAGLNFTSASSTQGTCSQSAGVVTCSIGTLASGAAATVTITLVPTTAGTVTNVAAVTAAETDSNQANNSASDQTTVAAASSHRLYFAHFGNGAVAGAQLFSQILLFNLDPAQPVSARILIRDDLGNPFTVPLNGETVPGEKSVTIAAGGLQVLKTDGQGPLRAGSVTVISERALTGVILFGGTIGLDGVGSSPPLTDGFIAPIESSTGQGINTAIAMMNLEERSVTADLQLTDTEGRVLASARMDGAGALAPNGHTARFIDEFSWSQRIDFSSFSGLLKVNTSGRIAATILQTRPSEFATLPVTSRTGLAKSGPEAGGISAAGTDGNLYFAHLVSGTAGATQIASQILLFNLSSAQVVNARLTLRDDTGNLLRLALNGETVNGQKDVTIPPGGLRVLRAGPQGSLTGGSAAVTADGPVAGVVVFGGNIGVAGVPGSESLEGGFVAPVESNTQSGVSTGIAIMNLENREVTADLVLLNTAGASLATARISGADALKANGHLARFVGEFNWSPRVDLTAFSGLLKVTLSGRTAATVIQVRPGQFATMPAAPLAASVVNPVPVNPVPTLGSLSPSSAAAGGSAFTLSVTGSNFVNGSSVTWNGSNRPTVFVSTTQLTATIPATDIAGAGTAAVAVVNPPPGGGTSSAATFTITPATSGTAPKIHNVDVTRVSPFGRDTLEVDISLEDPDGDMTRIELHWFSGSTRVATSAKPGPTELSLTGVISGIKTYLFSSNDLGVEVPSVNGVEIEVTDSKGNKSGKTTRTF